jgi:hypothetical protein
VFFASRVSARDARRLDPARGHAGGTARGHVPLAALLLLEMGYGVLLKGAGLEVPCGIPCWA